MVHYTLFAVAKLVFFFDRIKKKVEKKDGNRKKFLVFHGNTSAAFGSW